MCEEKRRRLIQAVVCPQASQDNRQIRLQQRKVIGILEVDMCQKDKLSKGRVARKRGNVVTQSVRDDLKFRTVGFFHNDKGETSTNAAETSFSPVFHSGSTAEFTTNVGYRASKVL